MGIFDFLKRFSGKKEEIKRIKLDELGSWIDSRYKGVLENLNLELMSIRERIGEEKKKIEENIQKLSEAKLKNPNITERARQIMEGNRKIYAQKVMMFLKKIDLPENFDEILEFCDFFDRALGSFDKGTVRNYRILQEFFVNETSVIFTNIRNLDDLVMKRMKKIVESVEIEKMNELKNKVEEMQQKIELKTDIEGRIKLAKEELQRGTMVVKEEENKIKELEEGSECKKFMELVSRREVIEQEIREGEKQLSDSFSVIKTALRKYERLTLDDKLVRKYLDNLLEALLEDKGLRIVVVVDKMKVSIIKGELELKEKKKDKILQELGKLERGYFEVFLSNYNGLNKKLSELKLEMGGIDVVKEIEGLKERLRQGKIRVGEDEHRVEEMVKKFEEINVGDLKENLMEEIKKNINEEVKIIS